MIITDPVQAGEVKTEEIIIRGIRISIKSVIFIAISALLAGMAASAFNSGNYITASVLGIIFVSLGVIQAMTLNGIVASFFASFCYAGILSLVTYLGKGGSLSLLLIMPVFLLALMLFFVAQMMGRGVNNNNLKVSFGAVSRVVAPKIFIGLSLFVAMIFGFSGNPQQLLANDLSLYISKATGLALSYYVPNIDKDKDPLDLNAEDFFKNIVQNEATKSVPNFGLLREETRLNITQKLVDESIKQAESNFNIKIKTKEPLKQQLNGFISDKITEMLKPFSQFHLSSAIAILVFVSLLAGNMFVSSIVLLIGTLLYEIFLLTRFIKKDYEPCSKETITF